MSHLILTPENRIGIVGGYAVTSEGGAPCCCGDGELGTCECSLSLPFQSVSARVCGTGIGNIVSVGNYRLVRLRMDFSATYTAVGSGRDGRYQRVTDIGKAFLGQSSWCLRANVWTLADARVTWADRLFTSQTDLLTGGVLLGDNHDRAGTLADTPFALPRPNTTFNRPDVVDPARFVAVAPLPFTGNIAYSPLACGTGAYIQPVDDPRLSGSGSHVHTRTTGVGLSQVRQSQVDTALGPLDTYVERRELASEVRWTAEYLTCHESGGSLTGEHDCVGCGGRPMFG